jgi:hypothetical protein
MVGSYPLTVHTTVHGKLNSVPFNQPQDITTYTIVVDLNTLVPVIDRNAFIVGQCEPNPAREFTRIPVTVGRSDMITVSIVNLIGKNVYNVSLNVMKGKSNIPLDLHSLDPGIYIYSVSNGTSTVTRRMIISND